MKLLLGLVLAIATGVGAAQTTPQPKPTPGTGVTTVAPGDGVTIVATTFRDAYFAEVDKANTLFDKYMRTSCTDPEYDDVDTAMHAEYNYFKSLSSMIEKQEPDPIVQDHEFEVFVGFNYLLHESVDQHRACEKKRDSQNGKDGQS